MSLQKGWEMRKSIRSPLLITSQGSTGKEEARTLSGIMNSRRLTLGMKAGRYVVKINPVDATEAWNQDRRYGQNNHCNRQHNMIRAKLWEGIRPGTVAKCFGQGHWAYGRVAAKDFHKGIPRGVNNNEIMPFEIERLSGANVRNGGFTGVKIEKA